MERIPIFAANWKMNKTIKESAEFFKEFIYNISGIVDREIVIAPAFTCLQEIKAMLQKENSNISLCAQNMHFKDAGAFTGEISPVMLQEIGVKRVIIGHSERRHIFGEDNNFIALKVISAFNYGILPILCVGEKLEEREGNKTFKVIDEQLSKGLSEVKEDFLKDLVIAYEPVWAIGTGKTATPLQAQEVHEYIRNWFEKKYNLSLAKIVRILYGGSVTHDNIKFLMDCPDVDGVLVGGASLKNDLFTKIIKYDII